VAIIKRTNSRCWRGCGEKKNLTHCWWKDKLVQALWKSVWRILKKLKLELADYPATPLLGVHLKECKPAYNRDTCPLFTKAKLWHQPMCPWTDGWRKCGIHKT
jgi:hypothetical protein